MNWLPISYPQLSGNAVDTINGLLAHIQPLELANGNLTCSVQPFANRERFNACMTLGVEVGGAPVVTHLSPATLEGLLMDLLPRQAFEALDEDLRLAVLETALAEPLKTLARHLQSPVALTGIASPGRGPGGAGMPEASPHSLLLEIRRPPDESLFVVQVDLDCGLPAQACTALHDTAVRRRRDLGFLPATVVFEFGTASMPVSELRSIEPGDIVLFDECYIDGGQLRINVGDGMFFRGAVNGFEMTVAASPCSDAVTR